MPKGENLETARRGIGAGREAAKAGRARVLAHVVELCAGGRLNEVMPWLIRESESDRYVSTIRLTDLDMCMFSVTREKACKTIRRVRASICDGVNKRDGWLTLKWLFDPDDQGLRLGKWLTELTVREKLFDVKPPERFPYELLFDGEGGV